MRRREFISLLGSAAVAWPLVVRAQQQAIPAIGWLSSTQSGSSFPDREQQRRAGALDQGLRKTGY